MSSLPTTVRRNVPRSNDTVAASEEDAVPVSPRASRRKNPNAANGSMGYLKLFYWAVGLVMLIYLMNMSKLPQGPTPIHQRTGDTGEAMGAQVPMTLEESRQRMEDGNA